MSIRVAIRHNGQARIGHKEQHRTRSEPEHNEQTDPHSQHTVDHRQSGTHPTHPCTPVRIEP